MKNKFKSGTTFIDIAKGSTYDEGRVKDVVLGQKHNPNREIERTHGHWTKAHRSIRSILSERFFIPDISISFA